MNSGQISGPAAKPRFRAQMFFAIRVCVQPLAYPRRTVYKRPPVIMSRHFDDIMVDDVVEFN